MRSESELLVMYMCQAYTPTVREEVVELATSTMYSVQDSEAVIENVVEPVPSSLAL